MGPYQEVCIPPACVVSKARIGHIAVVERYRTCPQSNEASAMAAVMALECSQKKLSSNSFCRSTHKFNLHPGTCAQHAWREKTMAQGPPLSTKLVHRGVRYLEEAVLKADYEVAGCSI